MGGKDYLSGGPYDPVSGEEALVVAGPIRPLMRKPKYLVLCTGGTVRSTTVAHILKYEYEYDALAASLERNTIATLHMLCGWADHIIVVEDKHLEQMQRELPQYLSKTRLFPIGKDIWRMSLHPDLLKRIEELDLDTFLIS